MKTILKFSFIILIPFISGLLMMTLGTGKVQEVGKYILDYGTLGALIIFFIVFMILFITGKLSTKSNSEKNEKEIEQEQIDNINSTYRYQNRREVAEYMERHVSTAYSNSSSKEKVFGWLFFSALIILFVLGIIFLSIGLYIVAIVCISLFCGIILTAFVVKKILERRSMKGSSFENADLVLASVKYSVLSSMRTSGNKSQRVNNTIYKVVITYDDKEYVAYSEKMYEAGEKVCAYIKGKSAKIAEVDESEMDKIYDEVIDVKSFVYIYLDNFLLECIKEKITQADFIDDIRKSIDSSKLINLKSNSVDKIEIRDIPSHFILYFNEFDDSLVVSFNVDFVIDTFNRHKRLNRISGSITTRIILPPFKSSDWKGFIKEKDLNEQYSSYKHLVKYDNDMTDYDEIIIDENI